MWKYECILQLYKKENPDIYKELRKLEVNMNKKLFSLASILMLLRMHVDMGSIPLPDIQYAPSNILIQDIPLPGAQPPSILKKTSAYG